MNDINEIAPTIIRSYALTTDSTTAQIKHAVEKYCDNPDMTAITRMRIRVRIEMTLGLI